MITIKLLYYTLIALYLCSMLFLWHPITFKPLRWIWYYFTLTFWIKPLVKFVLKINPVVYNLEKEMFDNVLSYTQPEQYVAWDNVPKYYQKSSILFIIYTLIFVLCLG